MSSLPARLAAALGADRVIAPEQRGAGWQIDVCRNELGRPVAWVRPRTTAEVATSVGAARAAGVPVVAAGRRTAYWRPLCFEGALVVDTCELAGPPLAHELGDGWALFLAGTPVRDADDWLRARGYRLPAHPDAFGDTPLGAMAASSMAAGIGMANATADDMVTGLRCVLGTGEILTTGAALLLGGAPFHRPGLPDPTGLLLASEGALGIITELAVRVWPVEPSARLSWTSTVSGDPHQPLLAALALARSLAAPGIWETFRTAVVTSGDGATQVDHDLTLRAPLGPAELEHRIAAVETLTRRHFPGAVISTARAIPGDTACPGFERWLGPQGGHVFLRDAGHLVGLDVIVPHSQLAATLVTTDAIMAQAAALPHHSLRRALYLSPTVANVGLHLLLDAPAGAPAPGADALLDSGLARLSALSTLVPYRWGRSYHAALGPRLDPTYAALMHDLRARFDPDGLLQPGVSVFAAPAVRP